MVIWVTGMSGAGKTTLCNAVWNLVKPSIPELVLLDGDQVRELFGADLDYSEPSRERQIARLRRLARFHALQGLIPMVAALYSRQDLLEENRRVLPGYFEVYLNAPLDLLYQRDNKGLYAGARSGKTKDVVGVDIPWHPPQNADLVFDVYEGQDVNAMARQLADRIPRFATAKREF